MNVTVFGASGHIGQLVTLQLLANGHKVKAAFYGHDPFVEHPNLEVDQVDIHNPETVAAVVKASDAIISCLGSWKTPKKDILTTGMRAIIPAMQDYGVKRIISLTGVDALLPGEKERFTQKGTRFALRLAAGKILKDGEEHLRLLSGSRLDWTVVRSPVMKNSNLAGKFALNNTHPMPWERVNRVDVATAMIGLLESTQWIGKAPFIHSL